MPRRNSSEFSKRLVAWQKAHGRHDLPWQRDWQLSRDPYRVWLSEIMLQQTQVGTVIPYYERFLERFPTLDSLASASVEEVMALWSGLGYYARARNLHRCAIAVAEAHGGRFPQDPEAIARLPGIGQSTANAIAGFCFGLRLPILDGNVKRVLCRCFGIDGFPGEAAVDKRLWELAESLLPERGIEAYIQGQMDLGATLCTRHKPACDRCPLAAMCVALREDRVGELPTAKPRHAVPEKSATMLILTHEGRVLLEPRPPLGIWGGLLSLPELPEGADPAVHAARALGCRIATPVALPPVTHGFTHFKLEIGPLLCEAEPLPRIAEDGRRWVEFSGLDAAALPAPIRRLLARVFPA